MKAIYLLPCLALVLASCGNPTPPPQVSINPGCATIKNSIAYLSAAITAAEKAGDSAKVAQLTGVLATQQQAFDATCKPQ